MTEGGREGRATSHRREGPGAPESSFLSHVKSDLREVLLFLVLLPLAIWALGEWVLTTRGWAAWSIGVSGAFVALLLLCSYVLRFFPAVLWHSFWSRSRPRRMAQLVLIWAWAAGLLVLVAAGVVALFT